MVLPLWSRSLNCVRGSVINLTMWWIRLDEHTSMWGILLFQSFLKSSRLENKSNNRCVHILRGNDLLQFWKFAVLTTGRAFESLTYGLSHKHISFFLWGSHSGLLETITISGNIKQATLCHVNFSFTVHRLWVAHGLLSGLSNWFSYVRGLSRRKALRDQESVMCAESYRRLLFNVYVLHHWHYSLFKGALGAHCAFTNRMNMSIWLRFFGGCITALVWDVQEWAIHFEHSMQNQRTVWLLAGNCKTTQ